MKIMKECAKDTLLIALSVVFLSCSYGAKYANYSESDSQFANQFLKSKTNKPTPVNNSRKSWEISAGAYTSNHKLPTSIKDTKLGGDLSVQYNFTPNLYASTGLTYESEKKIGWNATVGIQKSTGIFRPYTEVTYNQIPVENKKSLRLVGYDAGVNIVLNNYISPYFQIDNFAQRDKEGFSTGLNVSVAKNMVVSLGYKWETQSHNDSANVKLSYLF